jgi:hypothetical protein
MSQIAVVSIATSRRKWRAFRLICSYQSMLHVVYLGRLRFFFRV